MVAMIASFTRANDIFHLANGSSISDMVELGAPQWNFPRGTCLPEAAVIDGEKNRGTTPDKCDAGFLHYGCPIGFEMTEGNHLQLDEKFPVYYDVQLCNDREVRVSYNLYFKKVVQYTRFGIFN